MTIISGLGETVQADEGLVKESDAANFAVDVIEASRETPVVVDFWAPWCGPCKQLAPLIEKVVRESAGRVRLVKINVDENASLAGQLGVQSIPAVFAFSEGRPVDGFMGALPESQVRQFIERIAGKSSPGTDDTVAAAMAALDAGDIPGAAALFGDVLQEDPRDTRAIAGLARCYIEARDLDRAEEVLSLTPPDKETDAEITGARTALELARGATEAVSQLDSLKERVAADPADHQARIDYAIALNAAGEREAALDELIESIRRDKEWDEGAARRQLITLFEAWGPTDPMTAAGRRRLSTILFA